MLEAFERHLRQHNISKQFEEAKTKEERIEVCKKFLESEGITVKSNLDAEKQYKESLKNYPISGASVGGGNSGTITLDLSSLAINPNTLSSLVIGGGGGGRSLTSYNTIPPQPIPVPFYIRANYRMSENSIENIPDNHLEIYVMRELLSKIQEGVAKFIADRKLLKTDTDYATMDKLYSIKIGFIE